MNKVFLIGRMVAPPELRQTQDGISVATFRIGVNRRMKKDVSDFFNIVAWRGTAENCAKYLVKGQKVAVCGELHTRTYDDKNGNKQYVTEIQADDVEFLEKPAGAGQGQSGYSAPPPMQAPPQNSAQNESAMFASEIGEAMLEDEELPF